MAQRVYATVDDYDNFAEETSELDPVALLKRLRAASSEVDGLTRSMEYDVDEDGLPTDADDAAAFMEATCAIVEYWSITEDRTGAEAVAGTLKIGSVSLSGPTTSGTVKQTSREKLLARIGEPAVTILANAGLLSLFVRY